MGKYIVLQNFRDSKNNFSLHVAGEEVELSDERVATIPEGFVKPVEDSKPAGEEVEKEDKTKGKTKELKDKGEVTKGA